MRWHKFIFSEGTKYKAMRHSAFWMSWWLYLLACYFLFQQPIKDPVLNPFYFTPGDHLPVETFLLVLLYSLACYPLIYFILPDFIKGKWLKGTGSFILLCMLLYIGTDFFYWQIFSSIDSVANRKTNPSLSQSWPAINLGLMNFAKVAATAVSIKYIKYLLIKQQESQRLEKEKINAELQLLKAQVHPEFLFKTLNNIYTHASSSSPQTSGMLLKLADLLSYMLYECDSPQVPLEKEIAMMKEYMQLEKLRRSDNMEIEVNVINALGDKMVAPFLLLPFIENSFNRSNNTEQAWINLDVAVENNSFIMKLATGVAPGNNDAEQSYQSDLTNVQKRLRLLYPGNHQLKITREEEMLIVFLKIQLNDLSRTAYQQDAELTTNRFFHDTTDQVCRTTIK